MKEADFQGKTVIPWLRKQGCFVMKLQPGNGVPSATADVFFCKEGFYGWLEVKQAKNSKKQPGQTAFVKKMDEWSYARFCYPANWSEIKTELAELLK